MTDFADIDPAVMAQFADLKKKMQEEDLHPDLAAYLEESNSGLMWIKHPLVYQPMPVNGMANRAYALKQAALQEAIEEEDWHTVVFLHERPYRCMALMEYVLGVDEDGIPFRAIDIEPKHRELIMDVWTDSENIHQHIEDWMHITEGHNPGDPLIFGDPREFAKLPDRIELWRGDCQDGGWSWSTEKAVGVFFAKRFAANHKLLHGFVDKRNVFGYITDRNESEVMVRREYVEELEEVEYR